MAYDTPKFGAFAGCLGVLALWPTMQPSHLDDVAPVIGYRAARYLATWFPGRYLHVPTRERDGHPLAVLIGRSALAALVREFGGQRLWIPSYDEEDQLRRGRYVAEALAAGQTVAQIASALGLSEVTIRTVRAELVERGWLLYVQGFDTAKAQAKRAGGPVLPPVLPVILGTGEASGDTPGAVAASAAVAA